MAACQGASCKNQEETASLLMMSDEKKWCCSLNQIMLDLLASEYVFYGQPSRQSKRVKKKCIKGSEVAHEKSIRIQYRGVLPVLPLSEKDRSKMYCRVEETIEYSSLCSDGFAMYPCVWMSRQNRVQRSVREKHIKQHISLMCLL